MLEELLPYYERELSNLRGLAGEFAERYPKVARRLQLDRDHCEDPHVERIIEAFAFLAARIHRKLDDEYPEITEAFMQVLYPHFIRPMPSATILQMLPEAGETGLSGRYRVPRHAVVFSPMIQGHSCQFRTTSDVELWPLRVAKARIELPQPGDHLRHTSAEAVITLELTCLGKATLASLRVDKLRFFLDGEAPLMNLLYELLCFRLQEVRVSDGTDHPGRQVVLPSRKVHPMGFGAEEDLFESDARTFPGFRLLSEYFAFPDKFMFFEVEALDAPELQGAGATLQLQFLVSAYGATERHLRLLQTLSAGNFKLGCVPIVNLFKHPGTPIRVNHHQLSYPVAADARHPDAYEVYAIESVNRVVDEEARERTAAVPPFYSIQHGSQATASPFYWYATRERSTRKHDQGTDLELFLVDLAFQPMRPEAEILSLHLTCTNRNLPAAIPFGAGGTFRDGFEVPGHPVVKHARPLRKPTLSLSPPAKRGLQWRLISHLALNHLSMASHGPSALQETLLLYNFTESAAVARQIQGIHALSTSAVTTRLPGRAFASFVRGVAVHLTLDESSFVGSNLFLFASVLERFLAHSCPPNSFVRLHLSTLQQEGEVAQWPPRTGEQPLI